MIIYGLLLLPRCRALLLSRVQRGAPAEEALRDVIKSFAGTALPAAVWEELVLPARVRGPRLCRASATLFSLSDNSSQGIRGSRSQSISSTGANISLPFSFTCQKYSPPARRVSKSPSL